MSYVMATLKLASLVKLISSLTRKEEQNYIASMVMKTGGLITLAKLVLNIFLW